MPPFYNAWGLYEKNKDMQIFFCFFSIPYNTKINYVKVSLL